MRWLRSGDARAGPDAGPLWRRARGWRERSSPLVLPLAPRSRRHPPVLPRVESLSSHPDDFGRY